jgi:hypothetical protein
LGWQERVDSEWRRVRSGRRGTEGEDGIEQMERWKGDPGQREQGLGCHMIKAEDEVFQYAVGAE